MVSHSCSVFAQCDFEVAQLSGANDRKHSVYVRHRNGNTDQIWMLGVRRTRIPNLRGKGLGTNRSNYPWGANVAFRVYYNKKIESSKTLTTSSDKNTKQQRGDNCRLRTCDWLGHRFEASITVTVHRASCACNATAGLEVNAVEGNAIGVREESSLSDLSQTAGNTIITVRCSNKPSKKLSVKTFEIQTYYCWNFEKAVLFSVFAAIKSKSRFVLVLAINFSGKTFAKL